MTDKLDLVFDKFTNLLNVRFSGHIFTKEDAIRYTFFYAICQINNLNPEDIILESKHPNIKGNKEIDMLIPEKDDSHELVFEFKYDVKRLSVSPRPYKAGHLFADIFRLFLYKREHQDSRCFLIYVTDFEQANYLSREENRLDDFFNLLAGQKLQINSDYVKNHADTFVKAASTYGIHECQISSCLNVDLTNSHFLRIYEIF